MPRYLHLLLLHLTHASQPPQALTASCTFARDGRSETLTVPLTQYSAWHQLASQRCANIGAAAPACADAVVGLLEQDLKENVKPFAVASRPMCYAPGCIDLVLHVRATGREHLLHDFNDHAQADVQRYVQMFASHHPDDMAASGPYAMERLVDLLQQVWPGEESPTETPWVREYPLRIPVALLAHTKVYSDRYSLLDGLAAGELYADDGQRRRFDKPAVAEVGVNMGNFSLHLYHRLLASVVHLLEFLPLHSESPVHPYVRDGRMQLHMGDSKRTLSTEAGVFRDNELDVIYIDAGHTYDAVKADFLGALRVVKDDGILIFNDYVLRGGDVSSELDANGNAKPVAYGVIPVVHEACAKYGFEVVAMTLSPHDYSDIALRKTKTKTQANEKSSTAPDAAAPDASSSLSSILQQRSGLSDAAFANAVALLASIPPPARSTTNAACISGACALRAIYAAFHTSLVRDGSILPIGPEWFAGTYESATCCVLLSFFHLEPHFAFRFAFPPSNKGAAGVDPIGGNARRVTGNTFRASIPHGHEGAIERYRVAHFVSHVMPMVQLADEGTTLRCAEWDNVQLLTAHASRVCSAHADVIFYQADPSKQSIVERVDGTTNAPYRELLIDIQDATDVIASKSYGLILASQIFEHLEVRACVHACECNNIIFHPTPLLSTFDTYSFFFLDSDRVRR